MIKPAFALALAACLTGCSFLTPYKLDIPQGTPITADQTAKLKLGMTRSQVRFVLGSPLLQDAFHGNRWDYVFYESKGGKVSEQKRYHVLFDGDRLVGMGGDTLPARNVTVIPAPGGTTPEAAKAGG
ncbi:outer membrane protein assembly factor BamE [Parachitinimonas caeni]|uniref:Outer membrane protein assembly factor BamE n=1 Tax=Parachitinimonas caeni TaxID=3031301 RepID=A0ABT7DUE8_9NEIS|nr:outer membrane protein assembly factor BamE [Parachitinimonas caeni]MDK2123682.1 outer membrane protein assembly factor BamE [Parachitinimonas caeni]